MHARTYGRTTPKHNAPGAPSIRWAEVRNTLKCLTIDATQVRRCRLTTVQPSSSSSIAAVPTHQPDYKHRHHLRGGGGDRTHSQMSGQCPYFCNTGALEDRKETAKLTSKRFHSKTTTKYYRIHSHIPTQPFNGRWSGTTRVGRYQKKHSPTHIHPGHRTSFIHFLHLLRSIASSVFS